MRASIILTLSLTVVSAVHDYAKRDCSHDNCLRAFIGSSVDAANFCATYTTTVLTESTVLKYPIKGVNRMLVPFSYTAHYFYFHFGISIKQHLIKLFSLQLNVLYSQIGPAVAACTAISLDGISVPTNSSINLASLKANSIVTFAGETTFAFTNSSTFNPMTFGGKNVTITSVPGAVIDGNGQAYWDGQGSNGGVPKPDHFIVVNKMTAGSVIENLHIRNWPTHLFSISSCSNLTMRNMLLDNSAGDAPNAISGGLPAAHNSDGFDVSTTDDSTIHDNTVYNQDDCVAITSGNNITVDNMYCSGGHGLSIGSVGGKSNNNVTNILVSKSIFSSLSKTDTLEFSNSIVVNSQNGARIKSNYNTTGFISNITYSNISLSGISIYGIDVQQDYLNGGPTGIPSNGVIIQNLLFQDITGTAVVGAEDYYILCGDGSCSNIVFGGVDITGGTVPSTCNYPPSGCPGL
ncbi:Polygalacturonase [Hyphodiscus hymeniophilus]|uniref:endo-polygalacturonase n=1 Tax=Hyphodiscus hymeniophilus TaxID=353542 RepID=A0A9P6VGF0_9HELO|nr:Polygalacturonase [Hyphodiscus hymeniophilus]